MPAAAEHPSPTQDPDADAAPATGWRAATPNALTIARLVLTAAFVALLAWAGRDAALPALWLWVATGTFVVAGATDALDGYLARRWNAISVFGRVADPLADKLLILGAFVMLAAIGPRSPIEAWMTVIILTRELLVTTLRGVYEGKGVDFSAGPTGKLKMILQWALLTLVLIDLAIARGADTTDQTAPAWLLWLTWATVGFTAYSAWPYIQRAVAAERTNES
jgi:CDP-diacylglycerol--glycerol-3-phosphate 3-phosphatidyltransferase